MIRMLLPTFWNTHIVAVNGDDRYQHQDLATAIERCTYRKTFLDTGTEIEYWREGWTVEVSFVGKKGQGDCRVVIDAKTVRLES